MNELDLVRRCARGDGRAWEEFLRDHGAAIWGAARATLKRVLGAAREADAENVYQGVLVALLQNGGRRLLTFEGRCPLDAWLRTVASRHALNYIRSESRVRFRPLPEAPAPDAPEPVDLERLLDRLSPVEKVVLKMALVDQIPYRTIAEALGMSLGTVASHVHRARGKLKVFSP
jgi:RNA polymerase sigma factor (sigma-70 family)